MIVEQQNPFQRGKFNSLLCLPRRAAMNRLGFVEPVDRQRNLEGVAPSAHGQLDPDVANRSVYRKHT